MHESAESIMSLDRESPKTIAARPEHVFGDHRPFAQCHASTLVSLPDGGILVAWFGGTHEAHRDVGIWASERTAPATGVASDASPAPGEHWSEPRLIAKVSNEPHWNPVLFSLESGGAEIVLHFKVGSRIRDWETWSQRSNDSGRTWSAASRLVPGDRRGRGAVRNKPIRLSSGHWLAGASIERWRRWDSFIDRSPNGLDGWEAGHTIQIDRRKFSGKGLIQPTLWESSPGVAHALFRSTDGRVYRSDSDDDGRKWSRAYPINVPNNNSGLDVTRLHEGMLALACNPVQGNWAARTPLSVLISRDNGRTWLQQIAIETDPGEFSYPAIIAVVDGLLISYTWNRRRIAVARLPFDDISLVG